MKLTQSPSAQNTSSFLISMGVAWLLVAFIATGETALTNQLQTFEVKGVVVSLDYHQRSVTIRHEAISNYMAAMTMPFHVKTAGDLDGLAPADEVSFRLLVSNNESWIEGIKKLGTARADDGEPQNSVSAHAAPREQSHHPLLDYKFTNELGQAVSLNDFRGQALGITFFFTRCPVPDFCPRLSKNFCEASRQLSSMPNSPTNWHFLSVSFDTDYDTPAILKAYAQSYHYDPAHWNFLTGPADKIGELARLSGVEVKTESGSINHNFRTLIIDAGGHLQTTIPFGGNLSDIITREILRAAVAGLSSAGNTNAGLPPAPPSAGLPSAATASSR